MFRRAGSQFVRPTFRARSVATQLATAPRGVVAKSECRLPSALQPTCKISVSRRFLSAATIGDYPETFELALARTVAHLQRGNKLTADDLHALASKLLKERFPSDVVDLPYSPEVLRVWCDLEKVFETETEYTIRKHINSIVVRYLDQVMKTGRVVVKDEAAFGVQLDALGLNVGFKSASPNRSLTPDGNVLVLSATVLTSIALIGLLFFSK